MQMTSLRHRCITHNIANVDTPGYQRKDVNFSDLLNKQSVNVKPVGLKPRHIPIAPVSPNISFSTDDGPPLRIDGSNVDVDQEMALLANNYGKYMTYLELHERLMRMMNMAIAERVT